MKSLALKKTILFLLGLLFVGISFAGFTQTIQAGTTTCVPNSTCVQWTQTPYTYTYSCTQYSCGSYSGSYACASWYGCSGGCGTTNVGYCCPYSSTCTGTGYTSTCSAYGQTCTYTPSSCSYSGTLSWGAGCSVTSSWSAPHGGSVTVSNTASGYSGSEVYTCSDDAWQGPTSVSCTANALAPTSVSIASSVPNPVYADQAFTVSWSQSGGTGAISYTLYVDYVGYDWGSSTVWSSTGNTAVGNHTVSVRACNPGGCATSPSIYINVVTRPLPATPVVSVTPNPVGLDQVMSVSWPTSGATNYNYKVDGTTITTISNTATSISGTPLYFGFTTSGSHSVEVQACNVTGCSSYGRADFSLTTAPAITTFTTTNGILSLQAGGGPVTLTWSSINTTSCTASNGWSGTKPTSGSETIFVSSTATYDLTCQ